MKMKNCLCFIALGIGGTILCQQIKNGNLKKIIKNMTHAKIEMIDNLEDMM